MQAHWMVKKQRSRREGGREGKEKDDEKAGTPEQQTPRGRIRSSASIYPSAAHDGLAAVQYSVRIKQLSRTEGRIRRCEGVRLIACSPPECSPVPSTYA